MYSKITTSCDKTKYQNNISTYFKDMTKKVVSHRQENPKLDENSFMCSAPNCQFKGSSKHGLSCHEQRMHRTKVVCDICQKSFPTAVSLSHHKKTSQKCKQNFEDANSYDNDIQSQASLSQAKQLD